MTRFIPSGPGLLLLVLLLPLTAQAQDGRLPLLLLGADAGSGSMGNARVAHGRDAFSAYWNPAGLAASPSRDAALSYQRWMYDAALYGMGARFPLDEASGLGAFVIALDTDDFDAPQDASATFTPQAVSTGIGYGRTLGPLNAGLSAKLIREQFFATPATGYAFDVGMQTRPLGGLLRLGAALQNIGRLSDRSSAATPLPRTFRAGLSVGPLRIVTETDDATALAVAVATDVSYVFPPEMEAFTRFHTGLSAQVFDLLTLRAGHIYNDTLRRFSFGVGLSYEPFAVDYAYLPLRGEYELSGHMLTMGYVW